MSGILFPDLAAAFGAAEATSASKAQRDYINEDRETVKQLGPAMEGDPVARARIMSSKYAPTMLQHLDRLDANQRIKAKEASDWTTKAAMGVLSLPEDQRPAAYQAALADGQARGYNLGMPPNYDRAVQGRLEQVLNQARSVDDYFKNQNSGPQAMPPPGGGGAMPPAPGGGGVNPNNIGNVRPVGASSGFQQPATLDDGIRIAVNNVKAYPAKFNGGQPMSLMQIGARWAPVGDGANDPAQWARNVGSIGGLNPNQPLDFNDPATAAAFARGLHGAEHGASKVLPLERYAQVLTGGGQRGMPVGREVDIATNAAPMPEPPPGMAAFGNPAQMPGGPSGAPPGMAVGDTRPQADASGNPLPPTAQAPGAAGGIDIDGLRKQLIAGGGDLFTDPKTGQAEMQNGYYVVRSTQNPRQIIRLIPAPKPKDDKGRYGDTLPGRMFNDLSTFPPDSREYATARAFLSKPHQVPDGAGGFTIIQPMDLSMYPPATYGSGGGQPAPSAPAPGGPVTTQIPGGGSMTSIPGKGKPLDNSSRDDLTKASGGVLALTELVKSFDPAFGGYMYGALGDADNYRKRSLPDMLGGKDEKGQAQWWQRYQDFANLERNKLFGAALTPGETAEFNKAMINPGMKPDQITANLSRQRDVAAKALSRVVNSMVESGYNPAAIEAATGIKVSDLPSPMGGVPQAQRGATQPPPAAAPQQQPAPQTPSPAERGRSQFDLKKKYGLE